MNPQDTLKEIVAEIYGVERAEISADFRLGAPKGKSSLGRAILDARIRRMIGLRIDGLQTFRAYGELEAAVLAKSHAGSSDPGAASDDAKPRDVSEIQRAPSTVSSARAPFAAPRGSKPAAAPFVPSAFSGPVFCGVDIEAISNLPSATDYWRDVFYRENFTGSEIAYCLLQERPAEHFAARWSAKEALRKCSAQFINLVNGQIEISRGADGAASIQILDPAISASARRECFSLSLSHSGDYAIAMVIYAPQSAAKPASATALSLRPSAEQSPPEPLAPPKYSAAPWNTRDALMTFLPVMISLLALFLALGLWFRSP